MIVPQQRSLYQRNANRFPYLRAAIHGVPVVAANLVQNALNVGKKRVYQYAYDAVNRARGVKKGKKAASSVLTNRGTKRRVSAKTYKRGMKRCKTVKDVCKELKKLKRQVNSNDSWVEYRYRATNNRTHNSGVKLNSELDFNSAYVRLALDQCQFYDSNTNAYENKDPDTLTQTASYLVTNRYMSVTLSNNYMVPVEISYAFFYPTKNHSSTWETAFGLALANDHVNTSPTDVTDVQTEFSDGASTMKQFWKPATKIMKVVLEPGQSVRASIRGASFVYDPSVYDEVADSYMPSFKDIKFVWRQNGLVGHNSGLTQFGLQDGGVDYDQTIVLKVHYNSGGAPYRKIYHNKSNMTQATASTLLRGSRPIPDNLLYSAS